MSLQTPSGRSEFEGFGAFYDAEIAPYLRAHEDARQEAVRRLGLTAITTALVAAAVFRFAPFGGGNLHIAFFVVIVGVALAAWRLNRTRRKIAGGLMRKICARLGFSFSLNLPRPAYCADFDRLSLLPAFNSETWEDEVRGARAGADFVLCEARLRYRTRNKKNSSTRTVFHGQLLVIDYHQSFLGETVIKRDRGVFNRLMKPGGRFQRVGIASPRFEKAFEAWSTDQVEARALLDPLVLERFEELDRIFDGAKLRAAFSGGRLYVAMETGDKLNMGSMFKNLESPARVEAILKEFDLIFDLIDVLLKRIDGRLDSAFSVDAVRE